MTESLLSLSRIFLFGQKVGDLAIIQPNEIQVDLATTAPQNPLSGPQDIDGVTVAANNTILVKNQNTELQNGIYTAPDPLNVGAAWNRDETQPTGIEVLVTGGETNAETSWTLLRIPQDLAVVANVRYSATFNQRADMLGSNRQLADQFGGDAGFAKIYGFSYEGRYYDLARPTLFMVHGEGEDVADDSLLGAAKDRPARAPRGSSATGVSSADFQFGDAVRVWSYDKADYTVRMDVETGMFEQVILEAELDEESIEAFYSGQRARVSGQRARVSGQRARVSGQRARTRDRGD